MHANFANPLTYAASSLLRLDGKSGEQQQRDMEAVLKYEAEKVAYDDLSSLEAMLTAQAQTLHRMFTQAVEKYSASDTPEKSRLFSNLALKAQSYCRMTIAAIKSLRKPLVSVLPRLPKKTRNDLLRNDFPYNQYENPQHAPVDPRGTPSPGNADAWLEAMAKLAAGE